jgi:glucuronate isomerase
MDEDFLLETQTARSLYHDHAERLPILDYHCHVNPREIYENRCFSNLTEAWLEGDHYKWRAIRSNGVSETQITGNAGPREKFQQFAEVMPKLIGNPLYHWTHLELKRYLGIDTPLSPKTADEIWTLALDRLPAWPVRRILEHSLVQFVGTTDDPADSLEWHKAIRDDPSCRVTVVPTFRPDRALGIEKPGFSDYMAKLGEASGVPIYELDDLRTALCSRLDHFVCLGCRASDHGMERVVYRPAAGREADVIFKKALAGQIVSQDEAEQYKTTLMIFLGRELHKRNLVMQLHYGALRDVNTRLFNRLGSDTGFDCIVGGGNAVSLTLFLNALEQTGELPKTILYSLNPADDALLGTVIGCFQSSETAGKLQHGSAWWFNDTRDGMERQLKTLASLSALGNFVGMLTDSRSFLSYTRHEYFRRILCNLLGQWVEGGEYPYDKEALASLVKDVSYHNAKRYFEV